MAISIQRVMELSAAEQRGDLSREQAIEAFVRLVLAARRSLRAPRDVPGCVATTIARDDVLNARFDALFKRLRS